MKVYLFVAEGSFFCSHWIPIANKIRGMGHDLWILTNVGDKKHCVEANGFRYINISIRYDVSPASSLQSGTDLKLTRTPEPSVRRHTM